MSLLRTLAALILMAQGALVYAGISVAPTKRIELNAVSGRIDHMAFDQVSGRLVVAALGNNSVEIVDPAAARVVAHVTGFDEPQGVAVLGGRAFVTSGGASRAHVVNLAEARIDETFELPADPDNVRADPKASLLFIGAGASGRGSLEVLHADALTPAGRIALPGHPESFQLESAGTRIFVNVPQIRAVVVVDRDSAREIARWSVPGAGNFAMALDEAHGHLFVVTRLPAKLHVLDLAEGVVLQSLDVVGDADDMFYDSPQSQLYVLGGEGYVDVFDAANDKLVRSQRVTTRSGARTGLFVPSQDCLYVALPRRGKEPAELRLFSTARSSTRGSSPCLHTH